MSSQPLHGLPLNTLKQKAAVEDDPTVPLLERIKQARLAHTAALEADSLSQHESAYYHYFNAAGLVFPEFITFLSRKKKKKSCSNFTTYHTESRHQPSY